MAFALPAASVPPAILQNPRAPPSAPSTPEFAPGADGVTGFPGYARGGGPRAARRAGPGANVAPRGVVARDGQPGRGRPDHGPEREGERRGPLGHPGQALPPADDDLDREQDRRAD